MGKDQYNQHYGEPMKDIIIKIPNCNNNHIEMDLPG
jgi:hypothetical protein